MKPRCLFSMEVEGCDTGGWGKGELPSATNPTLLIKLHEKHGSGHHYYGLIPLGAHKMWGVPKIRGRGIP